jgi:hypothetical protein
VPVELSICQAVVEAFLNDHYDVPCRCQGQKTTSVHISTAVMPLAGPLAASSSKANESSALAPPAGPCGAVQHRREE